MRPIGPAWRVVVGASHGGLPLSNPPAVIGLAMLPPKRFHPFQLDTLGLGAVVRAAAKRGARRGLMGIGGSATNDGGFGLARALGWEFLDRSGKPIEGGRVYTNWSESALRDAAGGFGALVVATDVQNRLLGRRGASRVYGPQRLRRRFRTGRALPGPVGGCC